MCVCVVFVFCRAIYITSSVTLNSSSMALSLSLLLLCTTAATRRPLHACGWGSGRKLWSVYFEYTKRGWGWRNNNDRDKGEREMPKKGREKDNVQTPPQKKADTANMPQVWLPDQVQLYLARTLSHTHTYCLSLSLQPDTGGSEGYPCLPSNPQDSGPPTDEEQKRMAQLWAEEEQLVSPFTSLVLQKGA